MKSNLKKKPQKKPINTDKLVSPAKSPSKPIVVGIGASAGGLEALQELFTAMPESPGVSFVVIQHLSPDYKSLMDELLARFTKIPIQIAEDGMEVKVNNIYLIPPRKNISIFHNKLLLDTQNNKKSLNLPIDIFFRSLAIDLGNKAIGIVLSGTGSDGTLGARAIKEAGGMVMAQSEESARFDGMPRSCIATGLVDFVLPASGIPEALLNFVKHPFADGKPTEAILSKNIDAISKIALILRDYCGIDFSFYKENTIIRRLERRININRLTTVDEYLTFLNDSNKEKEVLYRELLIGVTRFFRDSSAFESLREKVIPGLLAIKPQTLRIWSTGCSTGEEVYSLAILFQEYLDAHNQSCDIKIFATDVDKFALEQASSGFYPESIIGDVDPALLNKYFIRKENGFQIHESIRKLIVFATHNLLKDPPFSKLDLIVCRNLFIYIKPEMQSKLLSSFFYSLRPAGFLFMGSSETLGSLTDAFEIVDNRWKIYRSKRGVKPDVQKALPAQLYSNVTFADPISKRSQTNYSTGRGDIHPDTLLGFLAPPSVIVDESDNLVHIINDISPFASLKQGRFSSNLFDHLDHDLGILIKTLLHKSRKDKLSFLAEHLNYQTPSGTIRLLVEMKALPVTSGMCYVISFRKENTALEPEEKPRTSRTQKENELFQELRKELQYTKESLQATVEELETANEELQSSNEELIASNEELQSTNEELQSVNEELFTVNSEYQSKIEELTKTNSDINNLLKNTEVGALFLDSRLCIRKITPLVSKITPILPTDIGRPISHIAVSTLYPDMVDQIEEVAETLQPLENEILVANKKSYQVRILPYRTENNAVEGILLTFVDISRLKAQEANLQLTANRLQDALDMGQMAWWEWDVASGKVTMDEKKATMIGYSLEEFPSDVYKVTELIHPEDYEASMQAMREHLEGRAPEWISTYRIKRKDAGYSWYFDRGQITQRTPEGKPLKLMGTVLDISKIKAIELEETNLKKTLNDLLSLKDTACFVINQRNKLVAFNHLFCLLLKENPQALQGLTFPLATNKLKLNNKAVSSTFNLFDLLSKAPNKLKQAKFKLIDGEGNTVAFNLKVLSINPKQVSNLIVEVMPS